MSQENEEKNNHFSLFNNGMSLIIFMVIFLFNTVRETSITDSFF